LRRSGEKELKLLDANFDVVMGKNKQTSVLKISWDYIKDAS